MTEVTLASELVASLDKLAADEGRPREELVARAVAEFIARQHGVDEVPDWHIPLIREGLAAIEQGDVVSATMDDIIAEADARSR